MAAETPPKGRPTPGKKDRVQASRQASARARTTRVLWILAALVVVALVFYFGSGTGGDFGPVGGHGG